jgi:hypothetical protein
MNASTTYGTSPGVTLRYEWSLAGDGNLQGASDGSSIGVQWGASGGGTVTLRVTDTSTGCSTTTARTVTIGTTLTPVIAPSGTITICAGDSVELDAGAGYASYRWSNGATTRTIRVDDSADYAVSVVDASGCRGTSDTVRIRVEARPIPAIAGPLKVCRTSSGTYSVTSLAGAGYSWSVNGGAISGGDGTPVIIVQWGSGPVGTVDVTVTSAGGCVGTASQVAVEIGGSLKPAVTPGGDLTLCAGDSIELDAGAGYTSYLWSTGETTERIVVRTPGAYAVTVSDASGCGGTSDSVRVALRPPPVVAIGPSGPLELTLGDSIEIDAGGGYASYRWMRGAAAIGSGRHVTVRDSGDYTVTVTDASGCTGSATVRVDRKAVSTGVAVVALGNVGAAPGESVEIPLHLISSADLAASGVTGFEARVRYRASLLIPAGATPRGTLDGNDRVLTMTGDLPAGMTSGDLARLAFTAALGDDSISTLMLESMIWHGAAGGETNVANTLVDGEFHLIGLCTNGGARLIRAGGEQGLKAIVPNPAGDAVKIEYDLLEEGPCRLTIVDLLGREVDVLRNDHRGRGTYAEYYDVRTLASGTYRVVLQTATARMSAVLEVVR